MRDPSLRVPLPAGCAAIPGVQRQSTTAQGFTYSTAQLQQTSGLIGGNQDLKQETAHTITAGVANSIASAIPGAQQVAAALKSLSTAVANKYGTGSLAARLASDVSSNLLLAPIALVKTLLSPGSRTFESDNYKGARLYFYYVLGKGNYTSPNNVADSDVIVGLKWFIDKLGVFVSGDEHIEALIQGPAQYMALHGVNAYTTMDPLAVGKASAVAQAYFNKNAPPGSWANTVGVFDPLLVQVAQQMNESVEQVNAQVQSGQLVIPGYSASGSASCLSALLSSPVAWVAAAVIIGIIITSD